MPDATSRPPGVVETVPHNEADATPQARVSLAGITDFQGLLAIVPLSARTLREEIKKGRIPCIRLPGGRRLLFHVPSVERALLRYQRGGI